MCVTGERLDRVLF